MKAFISHSSIDKPFVHRLKIDLNLNYIETWFDLDEMLPGDDLQRKLDEGLAKSTHFIIILSENSVNSDWVKYELKTSLKNLQEDTRSKVIPVLYRECIIPNELKKLLRIDLSKETVYLKNGSLEFFGSKYSAELDRLVRAIKQGEYKLHKTEKAEIIGIEGKVIETDEHLVFYLRLIGFQAILRFIASHFDTKEDQAKFFSKDGGNTHVPVVLPSTVEKYLPNLNVGDTLTFINSEGKKFIGKFAKYGSNSSKIALPEKIRIHMGLKKKSTVKLILEQKTRKIWMDEKLTL